MADARVPFWDCLVCVVGLGFVTQRGARRSSFSEKPALQLPWLRVEGRQHPAARSRLRRGSEAGSPQPGGGGSPPPGSSRQRRDRGPGGGGAPQHRLPPPRRERAGERGPGIALRPSTPADLEPPAEGLWVPFSPISRRAIHPWKSTPGVKAKPALTRRGVSPHAGPRFLQVWRGRGGCAVRGSGARRAPSPPLRLRLPLPRARPRRSAAPRPAPLSAELRTPPAAGSGSPPSRLPSALGRGRWGGGGGERKKD